MADVKARTEDWNALPWKTIQREVFRLQQRIYRAARHDANDNGPYPEEPYDGKLSRTIREWRWGGRPPHRP